MRFLFFFLLFLGFTSGKAQSVFAQLDKNYKVVNLIVVDSVKYKTEAAAVSYLNSVFGPNFYFKQYFTFQKPFIPSINTSTYNISKNCFVEQKPASGSYTFNFNTCTWDSLK